MEDLSLILPTTTSRFRGGGGLLDASFSEIRHPYDPKGPPLYYSETSNFGWLTLKIIQRRLWRQNILILRRKRTQKKKRDSLIKIFQKLSKSAFFGRFFQNFACGEEKLIEEKASLQWFGSAQQTGLNDRLTELTQFSIFF